MSFPIDPLTGLPMPPPAPTGPPMTGDPMMDLMAMLGGMPAPPLEPVAEPLPPEPEDELDDSDAGPGMYGILAPPDVPTPRNEKIKARLKPYKLRKANKGKAWKRPTVDYILGEKKRREGYWSSRDARMDQDMQMYLLTDSTETTVEGEEKVTRVTPQMFVNKLSFMVGRQRDKITVPARCSGPEYEEPAQNVEDFLYDLRRSADEKHQSKGNLSLGRDEAWFAALRGWLVSRVYLDPEADIPLCIDLYDPRNCYPQWGAQTEAGALRDMIYSEQTTVTAFKANNPHLADHSYFSDLESDETIDVVWFDDAYWTVVIVDEVVIHSVEHKYGFCPWIATPAGGSAVKTDEAREQFGAGVITPLRATIKQEDRILSSLAMNVGRFGNPPTLRKFDSSKQGQAPKRLDLSFGADNTADVGKGQEYEILNIQAPPLEVQIVLDALKEDRERLGIVGVLFGDAEGMASGFHQSVAVNAAEDVLYPITECIIKHRQTQNRLALNCILVADEEGLLDKSAGYRTDRESGEETDVSGVQYRRRNREPGSNAKTTKRGPQTTVGVLAIEDIEKHGVENLVALRRMTPQDIMQMVQAGVMATQAKVLSMDWVRENWLDVDDPVQMNLDVMYELIYQDEEMMRELFMPLALKSDPEVYARFKRKERERMEMEQMQAMMGGGGMMGPPGAGTPGIPSEMLPPPMQAAPMPGAGDPAAFAALAAAGPMGGSIV